MFQPAVRSVSTPAWPLRSCWSRRPPARRPAAPAPRASSTSWRRRPRSWRTWPSRNDPTTLTTAEMLHSWAALMADAADESGACPTTHRQSIPERQGYPADDVQGPSTPGCGSGVVRPGAGARSPRRARKPSGDRRAGQTAVNVGASGSPRQNAAGAGPRASPAGSAPTGPQAHQRRRHQAQLGDGDGHRVVGQRARRSRRRSRRTTTPASPSAAAAAACAWSHPGGPRHSRSQSSSTGPSAVITTLPGCTSPWHTTRSTPRRPVRGGARRRRGQPDERRVVESIGRTLGEQVVEAATTGTTRTAARVGRRDVVGRERVDDGDHPADRAPVGGRRRRRPAAPTPWPPASPSATASSRDRGRHAHARRRPARRPARWPPPAGAVGRLDPQHDVARP